MDWRRVGSELKLTFDADDVFSDLLCQQRVGNELDEVVDGVDGGVHGLEPLNLLSDGQRVVGMKIHHSIITESRHKLTTTSTHTFQRKTTQFSSFQIFVYKIVSLFYFFIIPVLVVAHQLQLTRFCIFFFFLSSFDLAVLAWPVVLSRAELS